MALGMQMRGMRVPPMRELVARAERVAFGEVLDTYKASTVKARLAKQARQRLGSNSRSSERKRGDWKGEPENNPVLKEKWAEMMEELGER